MELLFRNALASSKCPGTLVKRIAMSNKMARDSLVRATKRFRTAVFTSGKVTLIRDQETAAVTIMQFSWLLRMDMLRFETFDISCSSSYDCKKLSQTPYMPTLRELKCSGVSWSTQTKNQVPLDAYQLALAIIESNKNTLKVLDGLPISTFNEALPALELDSFVFTPLNKCSMYVFEYDVSRYLRPRTRISLVPFASLDATEIFWKFRVLEGFEALTTRATNNHVEIVCLEAEWLTLDTTDIDRLLRFFPKLEVLDICANMEVTAHSEWNEERNWMKLNQIKQHLSQTHGKRPLDVNLHAVFHYTVVEKVEWTRQNIQKFILQLRNHFNDEPPETDGMEQLGNLYVTFRRVSEADTKDAEKKVAELGLCREDVNGTTIYNGRMDFAPGVAINFEYTVL
ncbi:hypothetical protein AAVH_05730 [Aphelenchoides avenae]|nr:hypothetical protein AAVH_05730 [Aphelenchus avenae]